MTAVLLQSLVILSLVFGGGLWLGGSLSKWTERPAPRVQSVELAAEPPVYHGLEATPEPVPVAVAEPEPAVIQPVPVVAEPPPAPPPPVVETPPVQKWEMLYPINQFGRISETRAPLA